MNLLRGGVRKAWEAYASQVVCPSKLNIAIDASQNSHHLTAAEARIALSMGKGMEPATNLTHLSFSAVRSSKPSISSIGQANRIKNLFAQCC
jgi:hypothetical protein